MKHEMILESGIDIKLLVIKDLILEMNKDNHKEVIQKVLHVDASCKYEYIRTLLKTLMFLKETNYLIETYRTILLGYINNLIQNTQPTLRCGFCKNEVKSGVCTACNYDYNN